MSNEQAALLSKIAPLGTDATAPSSRHYKDFDFDIVSHVLYLASIAFGNRMVFSRTPHAFRPQSFLRLHVGESSIILA
jgi:hypothetical protein